MSSELWSGKGLTDKADSWALGCLLYELVFKRHVLANHKNPLRSLSTLTSSKTLSLDLDKRIPELLDEIRQFGEVHPQGEKTGRSGKLPCSPSFDGSLKMKNLTPVAGRGPVGLPFLSLGERSDLVIQSLTETESDYWVDQSPESAIPCVNRCAFLWNGTSIDVSMQPPMTDIIRFSNRDLTQSPIQSGVFLYKFTAFTVFVFKIIPQLIVPLM